MWADRRRLVGVDVARGLALLGMMSVHIADRLDPDGTTSTAYLVASGRASALFAVLAGVGLALARAGAPAVLARAAVVAAVGLTLGLVPSPAAVILVHYGLLFVCAAPFLRLRAHTLAAVGGVWLVVSPFVAHALRQQAPPGPGAASPSWLSFADPGQLVLELTLIGYYPVLQWTGYVLVGLAVGAALRDGSGRRIELALTLVAAGAALAGGAKVVSAVLLGPLGGATRIDTSTWFYGTTPTDTWWWLAVSSPHSGTPFDLLHTTGTSLAVIGLCLLAAALPWRAVGVALTPLAAAGSMTLTLYSAHVVLLGLGLDVLVVHWVLALTAATLWRSTGRRGPLEGLAASAARQVSRTG